MWEREKLFRNSRSSSLQTNSIIKPMTNSSFIILIHGKFAWNYSLLIYIYLHKSIQNFCLILTEIILCQKYYKISLVSNFRKVCLADLELFYAYWPMDRETDRSSKFIGPPADLQTQLERICGFNGKCSYRYSYWGFIFEFTSKCKTVLQFCVA